MTPREARSLADLDRRHAWHPFTQMRVWLRDEPLIIERGEGNYLFDTAGRRYLDGVSSLWCNLHGHRRPELDQALRDQADRVAHSTMLGLANVPATELAGELTSLAPPGLARVFYSDSGAEAVEVAARIAVQYWQLIGQPARTKFIALTESYHGDTVGAVSLGYSEHFHRHIGSMIRPALKTDPPHIYRFYKRERSETATSSALVQARDVIERSGKELAALVIEPMVQGAAGMWSHSAEYLRGITELARRAGALVICDEVATGFGRTGALFASEHAGVAPDMLCVGKGITGGYLPLAATLTTESIFEAFLGEPAEFRAFYYGHTYTGNPLAAAVALANLRIFKNQRVIERIQPLIIRMRERLEESIAHLEHVADVRQSGLMVGIELMRDPQARASYSVSEQMAAAVAKAARAHGVIIRPLGDVVVLMPPLSIIEKEIDLLVDVAARSIRDVTERGSGSG